MSGLTLEVLPLSLSEAQSVARYRYSGAHAFYNPADGREAEAVSYMLDERNGFHAVRGPLGLYGFCSFGPDGRVAGGAYAEDALDIGAGMDPALMGNGHGRAFVEAVVQHAMRSLSARTLRVTIASWNETALRVWRGVGFRAASTFYSADGDSFTTLTLACDDG